MSVPMGDGDQNAVVTSTGSNYNNLDSAVLGSGMEQSALHCQNSHLALWPLASEEVLARYLPWRSRS
jgi:hypothetical protein